MMNAANNEKVIWVGEIKFEDEDMAVYRDPNGGIFAIDASYVEQDAGATHSPFGGREFDADEVEKPSNEGKGERK